MSSCWLIFLEIFATVALLVTNSIPRITIHYRVIHGTRINFELLTVIDMVMFVERGICGGLNHSKVRAGQQVHAVVRSIDTIIVPDVL